MSSPGMERLKSVIPEKLQDKISLSNIDDLHSTCSSLLNFFENLPLFHKMVRDLTDPEMKLCGKNKEAALQAKSKGSECFAKGDYSTALRFYSQALRIAPMDVQDKENNLVATLYLNRSSSLHKLGLFRESLRDCSRALILSPTYAKAWYRRAKANTSLGNYKDALRDFNVSLYVETSLTGKRQIESERSMLLEQSSRKGSTTDIPNDNSSDEYLQLELHCITTAAKGRGMASSADIPLASLIHKEDPYSAIILKQCRETHCAFCFNELPADMVPCLSCSLPLYCSDECQGEAGGEDFPKFKNKHEFMQDLSDELMQHFRNVTLFGFSTLNHKHAAEHKHECHGMHWPAVLPSNVVLAGRILVKHIEQQNHSGGDPKILEILDLCQSYGQLPSETKLEFHVYSVILLSCLQQLYASKLPLNSAVTTEIIILLSQVRVNSMAIVRMKHSDRKETLTYDATSSIEQVRVAQAVYANGSLYNHSCLPNVHAYFVSRSLLIRATKSIVAGSELELSYGPQVGEWNCNERRKFLVDHYSFDCQCSGCAEVNISDLAHTGYCCYKPNCFGVVLNGCVAECEKEKVQDIEGPNFVPDEKLGRVARLVLEQTSPVSCFEAGHCLSCGSFRDLQTSQKSMSKAKINIRRLKDFVASGEIPTNAIRDALKSLCSLRTVLHPWNQTIAEAEDIIAQAFCSIGEMQAALEHSQASLEILETLYGENHIAIGNELMKLASIQLSLGHNNAAKTVSRMDAIFMRYYGPHADVMVPPLQHLKREAGKL